MTGFQICKWNLILECKINLAMIYAASSTKEADMGCLWYPLGTLELLEKLSTDVC
jgi:hypothetical protein